VRELDVGALGAWLDAQDIALGDALAVERMATGLSNEMFELRRGDEHLVLRRPARVALEGADRGIRREFRVLTALEGTTVPHARPVVLCDDTDVVGSVFYLMTWVDGFMPVGELPAAFGDDPDAPRQLAFALTDVLADLGGLDWRDLGLADFGRPDGFHERQRDRWIGQYQSYDRQELPGIEPAAAWLATHTPTTWTPAIMHGDYHMANVLVAPDPPPRVAAVCDWETASIGDPLLDLAAFLRFWLEGHPPDADPRWPSEAELIERYARRSRRDVPDLTYYGILARVRLAVMMEGIYQRSLADPSRSPADEVHAYARLLVADAEHLIAARG
jgi:aminoglycoside phosphotransferase (APT) family kinase protein